MCGSKTGRFFHANSNDCSFHSFILSTFGYFLWPKLVIQSQDKEREKQDRQFLESTYGTLPAAVNAFYLSGQQREMLRSLFPLIHNSDLRNFSDGHKNYGTSMIRLRLCSSYCIIHE